MISVITDRDILIDRCNAIVTGLIILKHVRAKFYVVRKKCEFKIAGYTGFPSKRVFELWYRCVCWWNSLGLFREACALHTWNCSTQWRSFHTNSRELGPGGLTNKCRKYTQGREQADLRLQKVSSRKSSCFVILKRTPSSGWTISSTKGVDTELNNCVLPVNMPYWSDYRLHFKNHPKVCMCMLLQSCTMQKLAMNVGW